MVRCPETTFDLVDVEELGTINLFQRCLDGLNLQHTIGNNFPFQLA